MKKYLIIIAVLFIGLVAAVFQYINTFQSEIAEAYQASKPTTGHAWSEMQCTAGICVTAGNKVGIGTDNPSDKLNVVGNVGVTGTITGGTDVCNGAGACLSQINSFIGSTALVNNVHNYAACTAAGGTVVDTDVSFKQCRFDSTTCPSGWAQYKSYVTRIETTCVGSGGSYQSGGGYAVCYSPSNCTVSGSAWANQGIGTCSYIGAFPYTGCSPCCSSGTCNGNINQIGCY